MKKMNRILNLAALLLFFTSSSVFAQLPSKCLVGYHENWNNLKLSQINSNYNVICLAFALDKTNNPGYNMSYDLPGGYANDAALKADIDLMHSQGKVVLLSVGGATGPIRLDNTTKMNTFISSVNAIFTRFGNKIDGLDLDLETTSMTFGTWTMSSPAAGQTNMVNAVKSIMATYQSTNGKKMLLTAAPEVIYLMGGLSTWQINNANGGAFLPILDGLRNEIDLLQMQLYNAGGVDGGVIAWNGSTYFDDGTIMFALAMNESVIKGFTLLGGKGTFTGIPADKVAFGFPATTALDAAETGYVTPTNVCNAAKYFKGEITKPAGCTYTMSASYPTLRGLMTWSINEDSYKSYPFAGGFTCGFPATTTTAPTANFTASTTTICAGQTVTFTDASTNSPTSWSWNFGTGASPATATTKGPHTVTYSTAGTASVALTATNSGGSNTKTSTNYITINPLPGAAGTITGTATQCAGATGKVFSINAVTNATGYTWSVPSGSTITAGNNTTSITVTIGPNSGNITVIPTNGCGDGTSSTLALTVNNVPANPGSISGPAFVCPNQTGVTYSITSVSGTTTYNWSVPAGANITSGAGTNTITVSFGSTAGTVSVSPNNACGNSATSSSLSVGITTGAGNAGTIAGASSACANSSGNSYSITSVAGASSYNWSLPAGATITSGANTNNITVTFGSTGGTITVTPISTCANGTPSSKAVTINTSVTPSVAIVASANPLCAGSPVTFTATPTNGGTAPSYQWKVNGGIVGTNSPTYTTSSINANDVVTVVMTSNAACASPTTATSNSITMNVALAMGPSVSIATPQTTICAGTSVTFTATPTNGGTNPTYQWKKNGLNVGTGGTAYTSNALATNDIISVTITTSASNCPANSSANSNTIKMTVNSTATPSVTMAASQTSICSGTSVTFTATPLNGGTAPAYQWKKNGTSVGTNAATFTTTAIANGDVFTVVLTSNATCATSTTATSTGTTMTVNSTATPSVTIAASQTSICSGTSVTFTATPINGGTAPAYQWKKNGTSVGTNAATFTTTAIANGDVFTVVLTSNATCATSTTATSTGTTMTVNSTATPSVTVAASQTTICTGTSVTFTATPLNGGTAPAYQWKKNGTSVGTNAATFTTTAIANGDVFTVVLTSNATCATSTTATSTGTTMTVNSTATPSVTIAASQTSICSGTSVTFTATPINGGTAPDYQWKKNGTSVGTNAATFTTTAIANGDVFTVVLTSNATCATSTTATSTGTTMTVNSTATPSVTVAASQTSICSGTSVTFTATPLNGGTAPAYQWKKNGTSVGTNAATFTTTAIANGDVFTVVLTSNATCATSTTATSTGTTMTVNSTATPSVTVAASQTTICTGTSVTFTATPLNGGTAPAYQWKKNGTSVGTNAATFTTTAIANGDVFTVVLTSNATCATSTTATSTGTTMTVNSTATPSVTIAASQTSICSGTSVTFTATPINGGTAPDYQWKINGVNAGTNSSNFTSTTLANDDVISVELTSNATCVAPANSISNNVTMKVNSKPQVPSGFVNAPSPITQGQTGIEYTVSLVSNATTYTWAYNGMNVTINANGNSTVTLDYSNTSTSGVLSVSASNNCGVSSPISKNITVNASSTPNPGPITTFTNPVDAGTSGVQYCVANVPGTTYTWTYDGAGVAITANGSNCITINYSSFATSGNLSVVANNGSGESSPTTLAVTVNQVTAIKESLEEIRLSAYPNPFEYSTTIQMDLTSGVLMDLDVYDVYGVKVQSLKKQEYLSAGTNTVEVTGLTGGVYFVKIKVGEREKTIKLIKQ